MAPYIKDDIQRYLRYGWSVAIVLRLIERKYGYPLTEAEKKAVSAWREHLTEGGSQS